MKELFTKSNHNYFDDIYLKLELQCLVLFLFHIHAISINIYTPKIDY